MGPFLAVSRSQWPRRFLRDRRARGDDAAVTAHARVEAIVAGDVRGEQFVERNPGFRFGIGLRDTQSRFVAHFRNHPENGPYREFGKSLKFGERLQEVS